ncbi:MAG TPA: SCO family protein [Solirubrobacteraceae bacterium]
MRVSTARLAFTGFLMATAIATTTGCGGTGKSANSTSSSSAPAGKLDAAGEMQPPKPAPEIALRDSLGHPVRLSEYSGKAVFLTFIYDHCPDTCPLIVDHLRQALAQLGPRAHEIQVVAVSVDPKGDTPKTVNAFLARHGMTGRMEYLIGSRKELAPVWKAYGIASEASPESREVSHTALVYGVTGKGVLLALYDQEFKPGEIVHDGKLLAAM